MRYTTNERHAILEGDTVIGWGTTPTNAKCILSELNRLDEALRVAVESFKVFEEPPTKSCPRCEGGGRLSADGKAHTQSEWLAGNVPTRTCTICDGVGRIPDDAAIQEASEKMNSNPEIRRVRGEVGRG